MNKILLTSAILLSACSYIIWQWITPVEIVAVHDGKTVLVKHFPYLKSRQIAWWEENKKMLQEKYGIPKKDNEGYYELFFQDFGDGYRPPGRTDQDSNVLCFEDMNVEARCIERNFLFLVGSARNAPYYYE